MVAGLASLRKLSGHSARRRKLKLSVGVENVELNILNAIPQPRPDTMPTSCASMGLTLTGTLMSSCRKGPLKPAVTIWKNALRKTSDGTSE